jgi:periplasmic protein TonB
MERRMFENGVGSTTQGRRALTLPCSIAIHTLVAGALVIVPLLDEGQLPEVAASGTRVFFTEPQAPPVPVPPPPKLRNPAGAQSSRTPQPVTQGLVTPQTIPDFIPEDIDPGFGDVDGDPNGVVGSLGKGGFVPPVGGLLPAPTAQAPLRPGGDVREPRKLRAAPPAYPPLAVKTHIQGDVTLECVINTQGRVTEATIVSGSPLLTAAARDAVMQWVYTPTLLNGTPVPILLRVSVQFRLQ